MIMSRKIYKYIGPKILEQAMDRDGYVGFKCSYPKDYNDPYELFLSIDSNIEPQLLAFYKDSIGDMPQLPTSCFSKSPIVVPMWAHYGHSSSGLVIEIDEEKLAGYFEDISIEDVRYQDSPDKEIVSSLNHAFGTMKPRHTFFFHKQVKYSAYFSKQSCWSYEQERRIIVSKNDIEDIGGNMIFFVPVDCITALIAGARIKEEYLNKGKEISEAIDSKFYRAFVGKSYTEVFFKDASDKVHIFNGNKVIATDKICKTCSEPLSFDGKDKNMCSWCSITEAHEENAANSNPYRILQHAGILEQHLKGMESIWRGKS